MRPLFAVVLVSLFVAAMAAWERYSTPKSSASRCTSLDDAVASFNKQAATHSVGKHQPPLSADEITAAIERWRRTVGFSAPPEIHLELSRMGELGLLPTNAHLTKTTQWSRVRGYYQDVWWITLVLRGQRGQTYTVPVRKSLLPDFGEAPPDDAAWGPPTTSGLQAAFYLVPARPQYAVGSTLACRVAFRNAGQETIELEMPALHEDLRCTVRNDEGKLLEVVRPMSNPGPRHVHIRLAPGEWQVLHHASPLSLARRGVRPDTTCSTVFCETGETCSLSWEIEAKVAGSGSVALRTGEIGFAVAERAAGAEAHSIRSFLGPLPEDELVGELQWAYRDLRRTGLLVAEFRTIRGSTPSFVVEVPLEGASEHERALSDLIREAFAQGSRTDMPIIRIRTDEQGRPDPATWEPHRASAIGKDASAGQVGTTNREPITPHSGQLASRWSVD